MQRHRLPMHPAYYQAATAGFLYRKPERFEWAVHRRDWYALCMGSMSLFSATFPSLDIADNGWSAVLNGDVLDGDGLLTAVAVLA